MSTFPSVLTSYTDPTPTSPLNAPSHSGIEIAQNSGLSQLEATVGLAGSASSLGTIQYDLRSPSSNGGGHVQSANKGGTGQTSYNKGDMLAASSSSVLAKIAVGADGTVLKADSSQTNGVSWSNVVANKIVAKASLVSIAAGAASVATVLFSASVIGSTLGTNNAVRFKGIIENFNNGVATGNLTFDAQYGGTSIGTINITPFGSVIGIRGEIEGMIVANGSDTDQKGYIKLDMSQNFEAGQASDSYQLVKGFGSGSSSIISSADQSLVVKVTMVGGTVSPSILGTLFVVDKIV